MKRAVIGMFDKTLDQMTATVYITDTDKSLLDGYGMAYDLQQGPNLIDYHRAVKVLEKMYRLFPNVAKRYRKRYLSVTNQIIFAFGPEFETLHKKNPA